MLVTRESDYAVRCVLYLACKNEGEPAMVNEIARATSISRAFLAKILQKLSRAEIVQSLRGVKGGFVLARKPSQISVLDVLAAIDGPPAINLCAVDDRLCGLSAECPVHPLWVEIKKDIEEKLRKTDFKKLAKRE